MEKTINTNDVNLRNRLAQEICEQEHDFYWRFIGMIDSTKDYDKDIERYGKSSSIKYNITEQDIVNFNEFAQAYIDSKAPNNNERSVSVKKKINTLIKFKNNTTEKDLIEKIERVLQTYEIARSYGIWYSDLIGDFEEII